MTYQNPNDESYRYKNPYDTAVQHTATYEVAAQEEKGSFPIAALLLAAAVLLAMGLFVGHMFAGTKTETVTEYVEVPVEVEEEPEVIEYYDDTDEDFEEAEEEAVYPVRMADLSPYKVHNGSVTNFTTKTDCRGNTYGGVVRFDDGFDPGEYYYDVSEYSTFTGTVFTDETYEKWVGTLCFYNGDSMQLLQTVDMYGGDAPVKVDLSVEGINTLYVTFENAVIDSMYLGEAYFYY